MSHDNLTGHNYDGIEEYDNPLPSWWLITFFLTIQFSFLYWIHYEFGRAPTQLQELAQEMAEIKALREQSQKQASGPVQESEAELAALLAQPEAVASGHKLYIAKCAACHGPEAQGSIGPNLVDAYWIHGDGSLKAMAQVIRVGVPEKGMPPWSEMMSHEDIQKVTVFVASKNGSQPANPKAPQGQKIGKK